MYFLQGGELIKRIIKELKLERHKEIIKVYDPYNEILNCLHNNGHISIDTSTGAYIWKDGCQVLVEELEAEKRASSNVVILGCRVCGESMVRLYEYEGNLVCVDCLSNLQFALIQAF